MAFLKQPRCEPLKPISRSREKERKRNERELEEISAFFLHKSLPESQDAPGRKQTAINGLSSLDNVLVNISSHDPGTRQDQNVSSPAHDNDGGFSKPSEQISHEKQHGRGTTYSTWSASHHSNNLVISPMSEVPEKQHIWSSTPISIREALAHTGIFENTGIHSVASRQQHDKGRPTCLKDQSSNLKSPLVPVCQTIQLEQETHNQPVRIVRYRDRGTMADEDEVCTGNNGEKSLMQCTTTSAQEAKLHIVDHSLHEGLAAAPTSMSQETASQYAHRGEVSCPKTSSVDAGIPSSEGGIGIRPERPKSPKWAVIEQLEAAADKIEPQESQTHGAAEQIMLQARQDKHATSSCYTYPVTKDHEPLTQDVQFSEHLRPARPSRLYLPEGIQQHGQTEQQGNAPGGLNFQLRPRRFQLPTQSAYSPLCDVGRPAFRNSSAPGSRLCAPSGPLAQGYATMQQNNFVSSVPRSQNDMSSSFATGHMREESDRLASMERHPMPSREGILLQNLSQETMQGFIAQLEEDVFSRPQEEDDDEVSPMSQRNGVQKCNVGNLAHGDETHGFQSFVEDSGHTGGLWEDAPPIRNQPPSRASLQNWADVRKTGDHEEEQRFRSTFWRPNRYPI